MVSLNRGLQDLEETGEELVNLIKSSNAENDAREMREKRQLLFDLYMNTKKTATHFLNELMLAKEKVSQKLLDLDDQRSQVTQELESMEQELQRRKARSQTMDAELQFLQRELDSLRDTEREIQTLQAEVDEETTEVIPSAIYMAQLYHTVTKIKWEHHSEPGILRGVHYGDDLATPINIDTSKQSKCAVSDYLWSFVSTEWHRQGRG